MNALVAPKPESPLKNLMNLIFYTLQSIRIPAGFIVEFCSNQNLYFLWQISHSVHQMISSRVVLNNPRHFHSHGRIKVIKGCERHGDHIPTEIDALLATKGSDLV